MEGAADGIDGLTEGLVLGDTDGLIDCGDSRATLCASTATPASEACRARMAWFRSPVETAFWNCDVTRVTICVGDSSWAIAPPAVFKSLATVVCT